VDVMKQYHAKFHQELLGLIDPSNGMLHEQFNRYRSCPMCGSDDYQILFCKMGFHFVKCKDCAFVYTNPIIDKAKLVNFSDGDAYTYIIEHQTKHTGIDWRWKREIEEITRFIKEGRLLDVGCGNGAFLKVANAAGFETWGIEINYAAAKRAEEATGSKVPTGDVEEIGLPTAYFDVITLLQVLEHLDNPLLVLKRVHSLLKENGLLVVAVPNIDSFIIKILGRHHRHYNGKGHINYFTARSLKQMIEKAGFTKVLKYTTDKEELKPSVLLQIMINPTKFDFFNPRYFEKIERGRYIDRLFNITKLQTLLWILDMPFASLTNLLKKGSYLQIYARK